MTLFMVSGLFAQGQTATGVGYGLTKDAAIEQAKRDAVEQGLGAYMTSTTTVTATSIEDNIYSKAQGFVKSFKVVKESKGLPVSVFVSPQGELDIEIEDIWKIDFWWMVNPVRRIYYSLRLDNDEIITVFKDAITTRWYCQNY